MNPKLLNSLLVGVYASALSGVLVCVVWVVKALIFSHLSVLALTILVPGAIASTLAYHEWDDWMNFPKIRIILEDDEEDHDDE